MSSPCKKWIFPYFLFSLSSFFHARKQINPNLVTFWLSTLFQFLNDNFFFVLDFLNYHFLTFFFVSFLICHFFPTLSNFWLSSLFQFLNFPNLFTFCLCFSFPNLPLFAFLLCLFPNLLTFHTLFTFWLSILF